MQFKGSRKGVQVRLSSMGVRLRARTMGIERVRWKVAGGRVQGKEDMGVGAA